MSNDPLHGVTLEKILTDLVDLLGWEEMARKIRINCFASDPSIKSSLTFLRMTPWARAKVETLYIWNIKKLEKHKQARNAQQVDE
ncbi:MAG: VF530 family DNA-binding protein [Aquirufa sp.]